MANNELVQNQRLAETHPDIAIARETIHENSSVMEEVEAFLSKKVFLNEDENVMKELLEEASRLRHLFEIEYQSDNYDETQLRERSGRLLQLLQDISLKLEVARVMIHDMRRLKVLHVCGTMLEGCRKTRGIVPDVLKGLDTPDNQIDFSVILQEQEALLENWSKISGVMHTLITTAIFKMSGDHEEDVDLINPLLNRFGDLNIPSWFFFFADAVGAGIMEKMREFEELLNAHHQNLGALISDVESSVGYDN